MTSVAIVLQKQHEVYYNFSDKNVHVAEQDTIANLHANLSGIRLATETCYMTLYLLHPLHLRNAILIGKQKNSLRQFCVKLVKLQKRATPVYVYILHPNIN